MFNPFNHIVALADCAADILWRSAEIVEGIGETLVLAAERVEEISHRHLERERETEPEVTRLVGWDGHQAFVYRR